MNKPANYPQSPSALWDMFYKISRVPRPSKKETAITEFLVTIAKENQLQHKIDVVGNVIIYLPASYGYETHPSIVIQNHMDMVCDAIPGHKINFEKDPIELQVKDGWVCATGTTLGADNGIGCAAALALITDKAVLHPPLELLFTVDEETGLYGAKGLEATAIKSRLMINLDTEEWGSLYIGCAGGFDYDMKQTPAMVETNLQGKKAYKLTLTGLKGGHSGVDIHLRRGNAIKLLTESLVEIKNENFEIAEFESGKAHNIIPRDAYVTLLLNADAHEKLKIICTKKEKTYRDYLAKEDGKVSLLLEEIPTEQFPKKVLSNTEKNNFLNLLTLFPHGAYRYHWDGSEPVVSVSSNLAIVRLKNNELFIQSSVRFFDPNECREVEHRIEALANMYNFQLEKATGYPSWIPTWEGSKLLEMAKTEFKHLYGETPKVKAIHAGLECGIIKERLGEMDIISFGPTITGAHSPTESVEIKSVEKFWEFFVHMLAKL